VVTRAADGRALSGSEPSDAENDDGNGSDTLRRTVLLQVPDAKQHRECRFKSKDEYICHTQVRPPHAEGLHDRADKKQDKKPCGRHRARQSSGKLHQETAHAERDRCEHQKNDVHMIRLPRKQSAPALRRLQ